MKFRPCLQLFLIALAVTLGAGSTAAAKSRSANLTGWTHDELVPYLADQLAGHPRFKGETVVFVALEQGAPAPVTNALVLAVRDRLVNSLIDTNGITIGRQKERGGAPYDAARIDCTRDTVHYFIGIEVARLLDGRHRVSLRVLDAGDRNWVTGIGKTWEGRLTSAERRAFEQQLTDEYFLGERDVPFRAAQTDMLATYLARDLQCKLLRQTATEYVIAADPAQDVSTPVALLGTVELVGNNLAGAPTLQLTTSADTANATLSGKAHRIDGDLYQYWITVTPTGSSSRAAAAPGVSTSAYVRLPDSTLPPVVAAMPEPRPVSGGTQAGSLLEPIRIIEPRQRRACFRVGASAWRYDLVTADYTVRRGECFLLQTRAARDSLLFLLNYQVLHGLVRLSGAGCSASAPMIRLHAGERLQFPDAGDGRPSASMWQGQQGLESFYALAIGNHDINSEVARQFASLLDRVPTRCTLSATAGLDGDDLRDWLDAFGRLVDRWQDDVDWQAVRISHVQ